MTQVVEHLPSKHEALNSNPSIIKSFLKRIYLGPGAGGSPIILVTQEAEIRRIVVQSQPEQTVHKTLS
jgi:hypothetical protein